MQTILCDVLGDPGVLCLCGVFFLVFISSSRSSSV